MSLSKALFLSVLLLFISGCAPARDAVLESLRADPAAGAYIEGVPFFPQDEYLCGPAALAGVMAFYGAEESMDGVAGAVYNEKLRGTLPMDLLVYARDRGFETSYYKGGFKDLSERVGKGEPLILFLNLGYDIYPVGHYIVAVGIREKDGVVLAHSGTEREKVYGMKELQKAWSRTGYSTLLVRPEGREN
ncbi:MAG: cysteine peptidase family C39 domain-containing protein [Thermodesulfobacteriota bacterium]|nr:MAG: cysteine peptidase family C39 domain-containing protein [Thermodesulfobacteriota bacterium]